MKVIDLLNKIANGEEIPRTIRWYDEFYNDYDEISNNYKAFVYGKLQNNVWSLNDEIEIIEEPKKIEYPILHKTAPSEITGDEMPNWRYLIDKNFECLNKTIYKLIDGINNLKEK